MVDMLAGALQPGSPLGVALVEAAAARRARAVDALATGLEELRAAPDVEEVAALAARASAMRSAEELCASPPPPGSTASRLELLVTRQQMAWPRAREVMTSLVEAELSEPAARGLLALVAELVAVVEEEAPADRRVRLFIASEVDGDDLVIAFGASGVDEKPVPSAAAWGALVRAERLAALIGGGLVRGYSDGLMIVGVTIALPVRG